MCVRGRVWGADSTAAQVTPREVASITWTLTYRVTACKGCKGGIDDSKEVPCPRSHSQLFTRVGPECIQNWVVLGSSPGCSM